METPEPQAATAHLPIAERWRRVRSAYRICNLASHHLLGFTIKLVERRRAQGVDGGGAARLSGQPALVEARGRGQGRGIHRGFACKDRLMCGLLSPCIR